MSKEPAVLRQLVVGLVTAGIDLAVAFGADISVDEKAAVIAFVTTLGAVIAAVWIRSGVTPHNP